MQLSVSLQNSSDADKLKETTILRCEHTCERKTVDSDTILLSQLIKGGVHATAGKLVKGKTVAASCSQILYASVKDIPEQEKCAIAALKTFLKQNS